MKFNWGTGIFLFLVLFVIAIASFVIFAFNQDVNLVNQEYYQKGVDFDQERQKKDLGLLEAHQLKTVQNENSVIFEFDTLFFKSISDAEVYFYRPSDRMLDKHFKFETLSTQISKSKLNKGRYDLIITWKKDAKDYELNQNIFIK